MKKKDCPICDTREYSLPVYEKKLPNKFEEINFSGSKKPDGYHYEMIRCKQCSLLYASEIYDEEFSNNLYEESDFYNTNEIQGLKKTYGNCISQALKNLENKESFLEIGCGNGFMLEEALRLKFKNVEGIEPSRKAINAASKEVKNKIRHDVFNKTVLNENSYDLVFVAMIIEHVTDINDFLSNIFRIIKPGGSIVCICHNERHFLSKILKDKHPIINDEHAYVFGSKTLEKIFLKNNFTDIKIKDLKNFYSIEYWFKMLPLPNFFKKPLKFFFNIILGNKTIGLKAGNLYLIAKKAK